MVVLFLGVLLLGVVVGIPAVAGRARDDRWGVRALPMSTNTDDPYRSAVAHDYRPKSAPLSLRLLSGLNILFGLVTLLAFSPGGMLLGAVSLDKGTLGGVLLVLVSMSGFVFGTLSIAVPINVLRRRGNPVEKFTLYSYVHHAAVTFAMCVVGISEAPPFVVGTALICATGAVLAWGLRLAADAAGADAVGADAARAVASSA